MVQPNFQRVKPLPTEFRSLYRLFLRANSAAVLHHSSSKIQVNRLWRPVFDEAALKIHSLQHPNVHLTEQERTVQWLHTWHKRSEYTNSFVSFIILSYAFLEITSGSHTFDIHERGSVARTHS